MDEVPPPLPDWEDPNVIVVRAAYDKMFQEMGLDLMDRHTWEDRAEHHYYHPPAHARYIVDVESEEVEPQEELTCSST